MSTVGQSRLRYPGTTYLDAIDERLLEYLDDDDELKLDAVQRMGVCTSTLLTGSITPGHIVEDWPTGSNRSPPPWPATGARSCRSPRLRLCSSELSRSKTT
ncbi:MAG: hypothetical protein ACLP36_00095 [Acidimicrobiales bacterium]